MYRMLQCFAMYRINRNIVECKVQRITVKTCIVSVLIETLWNVKLAPLVNTDGIMLCINRNIVECKAENTEPETLMECRINRNIVECKDFRDQLDQAFRSPY